MHARVVRFSGVTRERIDSIVSRIEENDGPPEGVKSTGMQLLYDPSQGTAIFIGYFATEEDLESSAEVLASMDASETPGTRESVDSCELVIEREA
jgi:hypothetical protein